MISEAGAEIQQFSSLVARQLYLQMRGQLIEQAVDFLIENCPDQ